MKIIFLFLLFLHRFLTWFYNINKVSLLQLNTKYWDIILIFYIKNGFWDHDKFLFKKQYFKIKNMFSLKIIKGCIDKEMKFRLKRYIFPTYFK
jgi:hypothetical protein